MRRSRQNTSNPEEKFILMFSFWADIQNGMGSVVLVPLLPHTFHISAILVQHKVRHFAFVVLHEFYLRIDQLKEEHGF